MKYPIPEIPGDFENKSGTDRVLKKTSGSGRVSGTRWALRIGLSVITYLERFHNESEMIL